MGEPGRGRALKLLLLKQHSYASDDVVVYQLDGASKD
jgi:hypothetical protein